MMTRIHSGLHRKQRPMRLGYRRYGLASVVETGARFLLDRSAKHEPTLVTESASTCARRIDFLRRAINLAADQGSDLCTPINFAASWTIGDKVSDIEFGKKLGTKTALIRSPYWTDSELPRVDLIVDSLFEAARRICAIREA